ncbi:serine/threonine-protein kinase Nek6 [Carpediemonas membranifera]|uniref:non-specific serine/threonine protein kinase n=1 Tax=Carpediemonas membranifera TaxID=201153 RepID=A0A8J6DXU2_9EUKA|nr:serine/threonine-protein kinase Nek6 [Carpediemonas membranifera]|eukprot:KAG9390999.1 serine/threonine-protein kinase Nek6 [Carpediemonas membranifera]
MAGNGVILSTRYEYQPEAILGKGAFGQVFLASVIKPRGPITGSEVELEPGTKVAIKMVPYDTATMSEKEQSRASNEVRVMRRLNHPNVVRHFDSAIWQKHLYIVMEYIDGHDLSTILETKRRAHEVIPEDQIWRWLVQICLALHNMHSRNILHRDLKPANIMVTKAGDIKVANMGLGRILKQETMARTQCGTPLYQAPEIISGQAYDSKVDVWAIGACLYEMCFLRAPFVPRNNTQMALYRQILDKDIRFPRHITHVSEGLKNLITSMLTKAPDRRPRLDDVFQYPMMKRYLVALTPPKDQSAV